MLFSVRKAVAKRAEASRKQHYKLALSDKKYFHRPQRGQWIIGVRRRVRIFIVSAVPQRE